jgi:hypothetical protein
MQEWKVEPMFRVSIVRKKRGNETFERHMEFGWHQTHYIPIAKRLISCRVQGIKLE